METVEQTHSVIRSSFDLEDVDVARRGARWHEAQNRFFFRHENGTVPEFREGHFSGVESRDVRVATFGSDPTFCERDRSHVSKDCMDVYFIVAPTQGEITLAQRGKEARLTAGDFSFLSIDGSHEFRQPVRAETHSVLIPGEVLRAHRPDVDDHTARSFASAGALRAMFVDQVASLCRNAAGLKARALKRTSGQLVDMLSLIIEGIDPLSDETVVQIAHRRRAQSIIERDFRKPELNVRALAQELSLSERYVQKIFSATDETVSSAVRKRRIAEACRLLERREGSRASVATIAYTVGFIDPAYFSRVFRQQVGISPGEWSTCLCA